MELENALGELVALGLVNADSFAGLRALVSPAARRSTRTAGGRHRRARGRPLGGMDDAGRWALLRRNLPATGVSHGSADPGQHGDAATEARPEAQRAAHGRAAEPPVPRMQPKAAATRRAPLDSEALEHVVMTLLRRYGVLFWRLLEREAQWLPPWRDLLRALHRLEARGEIRGGRFVNGLSGEQFALPEAVPLLREVRRRPDEGALVCVSGADPLNLIGTMLPGEKVPALAANRVIYRDGVPLATLVAGKSTFLLELDEPARNQVLAGLTRERSPWSSEAREK
jgi:ATP-dependent Lhr-like helicase